jgi:hypothetical protein
VKWLQFSRCFRPYRVFHHANGEVSLFWFEDDQVHLVEIFPSSDYVDWKELGTPECRLDVPLAARLLNPSRFTGAHLAEAVFAARGLALVISDSGVKRIRGFKAMPAAEYRQQFVSLPPVQFCGP